MSIVQDIAKGDLLSATIKADDKFNSISTLDEAKIIKVVRQGKKVKRAVAKANYKVVNGHYVKMSSKEKMNRKRAAKKTARKLHSKSRVAANRKRAKSMKKRT